MKYLLLVIILINTINTAQEVPNYFNVMVQGGLSDGELIAGSLFGFDFGVNEKLSISTEAGLFSDINFKDIFFAISSGAKFYFTKKEDSGTFFTKLQIDLIPYQSLYGGIGISFGYELPVIESDNLLIGTRFDYISGNDAFMIVSMYIGYGFAL